MARDEAVGDMVNLSELDERAMVSYHDAVARVELNHHAPLPLCELLIHLEQKPARGTTG